MEFIHENPKNSRKMRNEKKFYDKTPSNMHDAICLVMKNSIQEIFTLCQHKIVTLMTNFYSLINKECNDFKDILARQFSHCSLKLLMSVCLSLCEQTH